MKNVERSCSQLNLYCNSDHEPVFVTWDITMKTVQNESPLAAELLNVAAYFHSEDIAHFLLQAFVNTQENNPNSGNFKMH